MYSIQGSDADGWTTGRISVVSLLGEGTDKILSTLADDIINRCFNSLLYFTNFGYRLPCTYNQ